jgi:hypothetical protein
MQVPLSLLAWLASTTDHHFQDEVLRLHQRWAASDRSAHSLFTAVGRMVASCDERSELISRMRDIDAF